MAEPLATQEVEPAPPPSINVGGATLRVPDNATPEDIRRIVEGFRSTPEFDRLVDKESGAPGRVRMMVGSARPEDRLANLQRFYPDAVLYGEDNFVFTDPASGRPTLYNPEGLDPGDAASLAREGAQVVGSGLGAVFGAGAGAVIGAPTGPGAALTASTGAALGAGAGSTIASRLFDFSVQQLGGQISTETPTEAVLSSSAEFLSAASGQRLGELFPLAFKRALGAGRDGARTLIDAFRRLGVTPPAGAATGSRAIGSIERMLESTPSSAAIIQENAERVLSQTKAAVDDIAGRFGTAGTRRSAGETIKRAAAKAVEGFEAKQEKIYEEAFNLVGESTTVGLRNIAALKRQMLLEMSQAPASLKAPLGRGVAILRNLEADALAGLDDATLAAIDAGRISADDAGAGIAFSALRQIRTFIGQQIDDPFTVGGGKGIKPALKRIYGALTQDLSDAAKEAGPDAAKKLAVADRFTKLFMNTSAKTLEKVARFEADEKAFDYVISLSKDGSRQLARLRRHFEPEEWDTVAATVIERLGLARPYAQDATGEAFSVNTFLTNWSKIAPEAKTLLFGGKRYADLASSLDDLTSVIGSLKEMEKLANTSNTGRVINAWMTMQTLISGLIGFTATGDVKAAAGAAVTGFLAPRAAAKLLTNPAFVEWLATPVTNPAGISAHLGRLLAIAEAQPGIQEEIQQYLAAMRAAPETVQ